MEAAIMNNIEADLENFQRETANFLLDNMISDILWVSSDRTCKSFSEGSGNFKSKYSGSACNGRI